MALTKCPRCELNYMEEGSKYCKVCEIELFGDSNTAETEVCIECGEHEPLPGDEVCFFCMRERKRQENLEKANDVKSELNVKNIDEMINAEVDDEEIVDDNDLDDMEDLDEMEDIDEIDEMDDSIEFEEDDDEDDEDEDADDEDEEDEENIDEDMDNINK